MPVYFLDAGGALLPIMFIGAFMIVVVAVETAIMMAFRLGFFGRLFLHSLLINTVTLIIGYGMTTFFDDLESPELPVWKRLGLFFLVTILLEGVLLGLLNKKISRRRLWLAVLVMNIVSYAILYYWLEY